MEKNQEIEVKFYLQDLGRFEKNLRGLGAELIQPRTHELNLRFDTPRHGTDQQLPGAAPAPGMSTLASPTSAVKPAGTAPSAAARKSNLRSAILKMRVYSWRLSDIRSTSPTRNIAVPITSPGWRSCSTKHPLAISLRSEGPDAPSIETLVAALHLNWQARSLEGYIMLLDKVKAVHSKVQNMTFDEFTGLNITAADLGLTPADA